MATRLAVNCSCGALTGTVQGVSHHAGNRIVCYCDDCQTFAHFLGRANEILDAHGGTEIFQTTPAHLQITAGEDRLACMRLSDKGLLRWYAACCRTPIGNTVPTRQIPFVGVIHSCLQTTDSTSIDTALGPIRARVNGRFAKGDLSGLKVHARAPVFYLLRVCGMLLLARLRGDHLRSPFFNLQTRQPIVIPHVLEDEERRKISLK